ncbi:MAG: hypothetical protein EBU90_15705, partial [Proteobacteria bacterium]|nr:hypothetical protein [Pseudomonadota bacterium]
AEEYIKELKIQIDSLTRRYNELSDSVKDDDEITKRRTEVSTLYKSLQTRIKKVESDITFYEEHDSCPTCSQVISSELKTTTIGKHNHKKEEICNAIDSLYNKMQELENRANEIIETKQQIVKLQNSITANNSNVIAHLNFIQAIQTEKKTSDTLENSLEAAKFTLKILAKDVIASSESKSKLKEDSYYLDACSALLKDTGIKTRIIKQYLPVINKLVNKYLTAMDFFVSFELDEAFNETIKSRHRDDFSYASFSEGEKQRIDLALLFTWRTIAKMKNSASTNLLLLDEVFDSSLDANGTEFVMNLLDTIGDEVNVFVISHKGDQLLDKFKSQIKFEKYQNFSRVIK